MENLQSKRIYFDVEDRPPPAYWSTETQSPISDTRNNENESSKQQIKTKIDPKEWLKAPEFVPRSKQLFNESYFYNQKTMGNQFPASNPVNQVILPNTMTRQQIPIPTHAQAQAAALAATIPTQFSPAHTVIDLPQPVMPPQTIVPLSIGQPPPYFMSNTGTGPPQAPAPAPAPAPPPLHVPPMIPFPIPAINQTALALREALDMVPPGYSANITHINSGMGLSIPAVILKKKRRKRRRRLKANLFSAIEKSNGASSCGDSGVSGRESSQAQIQTASSEPNLNKNCLLEQPSTETPNSEINPFGGSCPDLSGSQLMLWDDYLFEPITNEHNIINDNRMKEVGNTTMQRSEYEVASRPVLAAMDSALHADGICSKQIRQLDRLLQGSESNTEDSLSEDGLVERLRDGFENRFLDSPASTTRSLKAEFDELSFRPTISQYGYPQANFCGVQIATFNPHYNTTSSSILKPKKVNQNEEDCYEGVHIRLNSLDNDDDKHTSSDSELPTLSRFQQLHWAIQQNTKYYTRLATPQNTCCNIM